MLIPGDLQEKTRAIDDFRRLHRRAAMQEILAGLTGRPVNLLSYEDIRQKFRLAGGSFRGLQEVPLEAIAGSVGRYNDFTRDFLPRRANDQERWAGVKTATLSAGGVPPIELYKIGEVYFVLDGNHRVSVARELGSRFIEAYVTEFQTKVPLKPTDQPDDLIIKAEYAGFLERTKLDELRPGAALQMTAPGRYWELDTQIEAHRYLMSQDQKRDISYQEAVEVWYDQVYLPTTRLIHQRAILADFPNRTETDLYLWIFRHRAELTKKLGWQIDAEAAALDLTPDHGAAPASVAARAEERLGQTPAADPAKAISTPDQQPQPWLQTRHRDRLFGNILVPISGEAQSWSALDQALLLAHHEKSHLLGLTVVSSTVQSEAKAVQAIKEEFESRCQEAGVEGQLSIAVGGIARTIVDRARWADLVVLHLAHPPTGQILSKLSSGFHTLLQTCPRPLLAVPGPASAFKRVLLAYDGNPKAQEGLYLAAYMARFWTATLVVMTVIEREDDEEKLKQVQTHLEKCGIPATFAVCSGEVAGATLLMAVESEADLIIMGSYGSKPILEVVLGSAVDQVLRESRRPILICR